MNKGFNMLNLSKQDILDLFPSFMHLGLIKLYHGVELIIELPRVPYLRLDSRRYPQIAMRDIESIMCYLDRWVLAHGKGYVPEDFDPQNKFIHSIQQVRREILEFIKILLFKGLHNNILEIGLGCDGGTHMLWRQIFDHVVTVEELLSLVFRFKMKESLDSRSTLIVGRSECSSTIEKVRTYVDSIDVLFIDGNHTYEGVAGDWSKYHDLVRSGGIIAFHDSVYRGGDFGVARFLDDLSSGAIDGKKHILQNICYSNHVGISYEEC
jgi:hypothetical protein